MIVSFLSLTAPSVSSSLSIDGWGGQFAFEAESELLKTNRSHFDFKCDEAGNYEPIQRYVQNDDNDFMCVDTLGDYQSIP